MTNEARTERLLAMLLLNSMGEASQKDKAVALSYAGFAPAEIAELLGTSAASVSQQLYEARQGKGRKPRKQSSEA
jgi:DNA-directed RNA polymerase specialized sigma24 family protein